MRKRLSVAAVAVIMGVLAAVHTVQSSTHAADASVASVSYSGEELFRGLFLGEGPVAVLFPEVYGASPKALLSAADRDVLMARIRADYPAFLPDFSSAMQSGDHLQIAQMMEHALDVVTNSAVAANGSLSEAYTEARNRSGPSGECVVVVLNVVAAVNVVAAAAVHTVVMAVVAADTIAWIEVWNWTREDGSSPAVSGLQGDQLVSLITERLTVG